MAWTMHDYFKQFQLNGGGTTASRFVDFDADTIKFMILNSAVVPTATYAHVEDLDTNEVSGNPYTAGGETADSVTVSAPSAGVITVDCADEVISQDTASGFSDGRYILLYKDTGNASTSPIIASIDAGSTFGNVAGDLTLQPAAAGLFTVS